MKRSKTKKEIELLKDLAYKINLVLESERVNMGIVAAIAGANYRTYTGIQTGTRDVTVISLLRIIDILGYELVLTKRKGAVKLVDNPDYIARYNEYKLKNANATRSKRGQNPLTGNEIRIKVKRTGISNDDVERIISRRNEIAEYREKSGNIFSVD